MPPAPGGGGIINAGDQIVLRTNTGRSASSKTKALVRGGKMAVGLQNLVIERHGGGV